MQYRDREILVSTKEGFLHPDIVSRETARVMAFFSRTLDNKGKTIRIKTYGDALSITRHVIHRAIVGYKRATLKGGPEDAFIARLKILSRYHKMPEIWDNKEAPKKRKEEIKVSHKFDKDTIKVDRSVVPNDNKEIEEIPSFMTIKNIGERTFFEYRKKYYLSEFEFNASSDLMLLETIVADEVLLRRITTKKLSSVAVDDKDINDIQNRYRKNLELLGVSRTQRLSSGNNQKGNVAQLSESLDDKIEEVKKLSNVEVREKLINKLLVESTLITVSDVMQSIEELEYLRQRALRPDMEAINPIATKNELPVLEELDAIINEIDKKELT